MDGNPFPLFEVEDETIFLAVGLAAGLFSSIFAFAGFATCYAAWSQCCKSQEWGICSVICIIFQSLFSIPFVAVPILPYLLAGIWITPLVGYTLPFLCFFCCKCSNSKKLKVQNPRYKQNENNNSYNVNDAYNNNINANQYQNNPEPIPVIYVNNNIDNIYNNNQAIPLQNVAVYNWLNDIGLNEYYDAMINEGYQTVKDILTITENDLINMNITKQMHVKKNYESYKSISECQWCKYWSI
eukprot:165716_1